MVKMRTLDLNSFLGYRMCVLGLWAIRFIMLWIMLFFSNASVDHGSAMCEALCYIFVIYICVMIVCLDCYNMISCESLWGSRHNLKVDFLDWSLPFEALVRGYMNVHSSSASYAINYKLILCFLLSSALPIH